jgi:hypothetical protein
MKKMLALLLIAVVFASGCSVIQPTGYTRVASGALYTNVKHPTALQDPVQPFKRPYKVLGHVHGTSTQFNTLRVAAYGDGSIDTAIKNALANAPGANDLIDIRVDTEIKSVLMVMIEVTTHVRGTAIQYTD